MMNSGGSEWQKYNALFREQLLSNQNDNGSWPKPGAGGSDHYSSCLSTLMLEVYYRFLPGTGSM
jgi:hypothetical protein